MDVPAIGIDLGTTYSCVAVYHKGEVHIIPNLEQGSDLTTPSYVFLDSDGEEVVGLPAKSNAYRNLDNTIYDVKRILGREFKNPELQNDMKFWPFVVKQGDEDIPMVEVNGELLYPEEISAKLLLKLKTFAEKYLQLETGAIKKAVITVPAYFHDGQRQATIDAGELAGLEVLTILNEPTAAAIAYSMKVAGPKSQKILVYDLGGGTFDVAVLNMEDNKIEVLGVNGDTHLGGEDFDRNLMEYCLSQFKVENDVDLLKLKDSADSAIKKKAKRSLRRLQTYCETAKKDLTSGVKVTLSVDAFHNGEDMIVNITRQQFEDMNKTYFEKTIKLVDSTLQELGLNKGDIHDIVLVGGSTRIPKVQQLLKNYFEGKTLNSSINPDQAVAYGAAVQAALMTGNKLDGQVKFDKVQDVTPMALGVENSNKTFCVSNPKNSKIPAKKRRKRHTVHDDQSRVTLKIYQGNDLELARNNRLLGKFSVYGIPPNKRGEEKIYLTMEINEMGILHVEAISQSDQSRRNSITIVENKNRMSQETKRKLLAKINPKGSTATGVGLLSRIKLSPAAARGPRDHDVQ